MKKVIILLVIVCILGGAGYGGYRYYKSYMKKNQPNAEIANEKVEVPSPSIKINKTDEVAKGKDPQYTDVTVDGISLYPSLSGVYEPIWDSYESFPIDILAKGYENMDASFKLIWAKHYLYVQITVKDSTDDVSGETYADQDSVEIFVNEDGNKNSKLLVGDAHYVINRKGEISLGFGASEDVTAVTYEIDPILNEDGNVTYGGYIVEAVIPLMTIKASKNESIGFDIQVNNAVNGENFIVYKWASSYLYTYQNFAAVGTMTFK